MREVKHGKAVGPMVQSAELEESLAGAKVVDFSCRCLASLTDMRCSKPQTSNPVCSCPRIFASDAVEVENFKFCIEEQARTARCSTRAVPV